MMGGRLGRSSRGDVLRLAALILLLLAAIGPWGYTPDGVPPPEWCGDRHVLLANGSCVRLVSGMEILRFMTDAFISLNRQLVDGTLVLPDRAWEFFGVLIIFTLLLMLVQPFISTVALLFGEGRLRREYQVAAWGLALAGSGTLLIGSIGWGLGGRMWGMWLYVGLAASVLAVELLTIRRSRRKRRLKEEV